MPPFENLLRRNCAAALCKHRPLGQRCRQVPYAGIQTPHCKGVGAKRRGGRKGRPETVSGADTVLGDEVGFDGLPVDEPVHILPDRRHMADHRREGAEKPAEAC